MGKVNISDDQVRTAYESQVNLQAYALEEVADVLRGRLADKEVERRWPRGWTASGNAPGSKYSTQRLAWRTRRRHRAAARTHEGFRVMEGSLRTLARCATLALVLAACGPEGRTFVPGSEMLPGPGYFHIEGDPIVAEMTLTFRYIGSDGVVSQVKDTIQPGGQTVVDRTTLPGSHRLTLNAFPCSGSFAVETDRETDLLVRITAEGCEISIVRVHEVGEVTH